MTEQFIRTVTFDGTVSHAIAIHHWINTGQYEYDKEPNERTIQEITQEAAEENSNTADGSPIPTPSYIIEDPVRTGKKLPGFTFTQNTTIERTAVGDYIITPYHIPEEYPATVNEKLAHIIESVQIMDTIPGHYVRTEQVVAEISDVLNHPDTIKVAAQAAAIARQEIGNTGTPINPTASALDYHVARLILQRITNSQETQGTTP